MYRAIFESPHAPWYLHMGRAIDCRGGHTRRMGRSCGWLRAAEWGGEPHRPAAVAELMTAAGFQNMRIEAAAGIASASLIIGRKPLGN